MGFLDYFSWQIWFIILIVIIVFIWFWTSNSKDREFIGLKPLYDSVDIPQVSVPKGDTIKPEMNHNIASQMGYDIDEALFISPVKLEKIIPHPFSRIVSEEAVSVENTPVAPIKKMSKVNLIKSSKTIATKTKDVSEKNKALSAISFVTLDEDISSNRDNLSIVDNLSIKNGVEIENEDETEKICKKKKHKSKTKNKSKSLGEELTCQALKELLNETHIEKNIRPKFLTNPKTGRCLEIDCWSEKYQIGAEYNGIHHYEFPSIFCKTEEDFEDQIYRDEIKRELADINNTPIITIPCTVDSYTFDEENIKYKYIKRNKDQRYKLIKQYMKQKLEPILEERQ